MKKYLLLIALFAAMFLLWGNYASAFTCQSLTDCVNNECKTIAGEEACVQIQSTPAPAGDTTNQASTNPTKCTKSWSILYDLPNTVDVELWLLCKCATWYGEYYDSALNRTTCELCSRKDVCCGVKLNTNVPFIGNCLEEDTSDPTAVSQEKAFPVLMSSLTKILVTVILIISFVLIVVWGIMIASAWPNQSKASEGRKLIMKVVIGIALLGASGVILRLINPNFFG